MYNFIKNVAHKKITWLVVILFVFLVGAFWFVYDARDIFSDAYWDNRIAQVGAEDAYKEFVQEFRVLPAYEAHVYAHTFGAVLYHHEGINGISICDSSFLYGCFHEVIGNAIAEHGLDIVDALHEKCIDTGCEHGIGHGLQTYLGYTFEDLTQAIDLCDRYIPGSNPISGCYGGVFMEYNLRLMLSEVGAYRTFDENWYEPCDALANHPSYTACVFRLPRWWLRTSLKAAALPDAMVIMGDTCRALPTTEDTLACFGGIVNAISVDLNFSSNDVISMCTLAAHTEEEMSACGIPALMAMHSVSGVSPAEIAYACTDVATSTHMGACIEKYTTAEKSSGTIAEPHL